MQHATVRDVGHSFRKPCPGPGEVFRVVEVCRSACLASMRLEAQSLAPCNSSSVMVMEELLKSQMKGTSQMTTTLLGTKKGEKIEMKAVKVEIY